jgi:hypothetical protein
MRGPPARRGGGRRETVIPPQKNTGESMRDCVRSHGSVCTTIPEKGAPGPRCCCAKLAIRIGCLKVLRLGGGASEPRAAEQNERTPTHQPVVQPP